MQIQPGSRWPVGYRCQKDTWSIIQQAIWFGLALFSFSWFVGKPGVELVPYLIILVFLINVSWLEWSSRCEDRVRVQRAAVAYNAALAAWAVHQHREAQEREASPGSARRSSIRRCRRRVEAKLVEDRRLEEVARQRWINHRDNGVSF